MGSASAAATRSAAAARACAVMSEAIAVAPEPSPTTALQRPLGSAWSQVTTASVTHGGLPGASSAARTPPGVAMLESRARREGLAELRRTAETGGAEGYVWWGGATSSV